MLKSLKLLGGQGWLWCGTLFLLCVGFSGGVFQLQEYEELVSNANKESYSYPQHGAGDTGDVARPLVCSVEHQAEAQRRLRTQTPLQETGTDKGTGFDLNLADCISSN